MKCIRNLETGDIKRVPNEIAKKNIDEVSDDAREWEYIPKHIWKEAGRPYG